jgi:cellulose synthase/poly-beta-1,6-N-acetylglucosamine synthase-like glycosyltransferase
MMAVMLIALAWAALVAQLLSMAAAWWNHSHTPPLDDAPPSAREPSLLVVVPARDEEGNIGACVRALLASRLTRLRVRVVDDGSSDRTAAIARAIAEGDPRLEVVEAGPLPDGWRGKNHAAWIGARGAAEDFVLFADADLRVGPDCLARALATAQRAGADLLCLVPRMVTIGFWEEVVQALVAQLIVVWLPAADVNDPAKRRAAGTGPFMLFRRGAYERIGGHEAIRGEPIDDLRLAERVKHAGLRLLLARGVDHASVRMYDSLRAIVDGWSKNFHVALGPAPWAAPLLAAALLLVYGGAWLVGPIALGLGDGRAAMVGFGAAAAAALARIDLARRYRITARRCWLAPLGAAVVAWILVRAGWRVMRRRPILWKGRAA